MAAGGTPWPIAIQEESTRGYQMAEHESVLGRNPDIRRGGQVEWSFPPVQKDSVYFAPGPGIHPKSSGVSENNLTVIKGKSADPGIFRLARVH